MITVENKKTITKLAKTELKANKLRNTLAVLAIILTTLMLTTVFSIGGSYILSIKDREVKMTGADSDAMIMGPTYDQINQLPENSKVKNAGARIACGTIIEYENIPNEIPLIWANQSAWNNIITPALEFVKGRYPENRKEFMLSLKALKNLGINHPKVGMKLKVKYAGKKLETDEFVLSGYYNDYTNKATAYISDQFFQECQVKTPSFENSVLYINLKNPFINDETLRQLEKEFEIKENQRLVANTALPSIFARAALGTLLISFLIMASGYLLIYNVLYISISKDVRFYGLLKTVGITSKQIKTFIGKQVFYLSGIGIPIGLLLGSVIALLVVPSIVRSLNFTGSGDVYFHPAIYLGAIIFTLFTIIAGSSKPAKIASDVSPVEAVKYEGTVSGKFKKRGFGGAKPWRMALGNITREKKRMVIVFLSLFLGITAFICATSFVKSNSADNVLNTLLNYDFQVINKTMGYEKKAPEQKIHKDIVDHVNRTPGVKETHKISANKMLIPYQKNLADYFSAGYERFMDESPKKGRQRIKEHPEAFYGMFVGIDESYFDDINQSLDKPIDKHNFLSGKTCIITATPLMEKEVKKLIGNTFQYTLPEGRDTAAQTIKIAAGHKDSMVLYGGFWFNIIVSDSFAKKQLSDPTIDHLNVVYKKTYDQKTEQAIKKRLSSESLLGYESKIDRRENMKESENQLSVFGNGIAIVLALLGFLNYINMMTAGIQSRKKELAVLQGIGMTEKEQRNMLMIEGLGYGIISIVMASVLGTLIGYFVFKAFDTYQVSFIVPVVQNLLFFAVILAICTVIPAIVYGFMQKQTIIEQLRDIH